MEDNSKKIRSDLLEIGDEYEPLYLHVTPELNKQFKTAFDSFHLRNEEIVFPGLLLHFCSITQSPSFVLEDGTSAVGAKFEMSYKKTATLNMTYKISWKVDDVYERRSRVYQICDVKVEDETGEEVLWRRITNTFIGGDYLKRRVAWEKEKGYRRAININEFPKEGYEIVGKVEELTLKKMRYFSGGLPGMSWPSGNIHTSREISIRSGIGRPIASGMMFETQLTDLMVNFFGENWLTYGKIEVIAIDMAGDGDSVVSKAVIRSIELDNQLGCKADLYLWCENQYGNKIMVGRGIGEWKQ